jgi:hypothetical protein
MEGFMRAVAQLDEEAGMDDVLTVAARSGIELLGPIPDDSPTTVSHTTIEGVFNR